MRWSAVVLSAVLLLPATCTAGDKALDWVKVTDKAGWQPRDSSGEVGLQGPALAPRRMVPVLRRPAPRRLELRPTGRPGGS